MKIKMFTHTDLDGIGCSVLLQNVYRNHEVDVEYCGFIKILKIA